MSTVLVTGGAGFIAVHCIVQLLEAGHQVRATLRDEKRAEEVRTMVRAGGVEPGDRLSFVLADLASDDGWTDAVTGCTYVIHPASPTPALRAEHDDEFLMPAREGALRLLRAARDAGVRRVVLTSAFGAVCWSQTPKPGAYVETDWSDTAPWVPLYQRSKTLAERAAWDFVAREGRELELAVVNPVGVLGPALGPDLSHSLAILHQLLSGARRAYPRIASPYVDVRDVASLHLLAMTHPAACGQRFIAAAAGTWSLADMASVLHARLGESARKVPRREVPDWLVRLAARFDPSIAPVVPHLGSARRTTSEKARRLLGWSPRSFEDAVVAAAESLQRLAVV